MMTLAAVFAAQARETYAYHQHALKKRLLQRPPLQVCFSCMQDNALPGIVQKPTGSTSKTV
jgi:hypothetical protein